MVRVFKDAVYIIVHYLLIEEFDLNVQALRCTYNFVISCAWFNKWSFAALCRMGISLQ